MLSNNEEKVSVSNKATDLAVFGHLVTDKKLHSAGVARHGVMSKFRMFRTFLDMLKVR